jgi:hypothetical protein
MMGLRLVQEEFLRRSLKRFGLTLERFARQMLGLLAWGLWKELGQVECLRLTRRGYLLGNQVFLEFI